MARTQDTGKPIFFNSRNMGDPSTEYVCWLDVMGTNNAMLRSVRVAANFVFKLHCAVLNGYDILARDADATAVRLYPVMDGVYITSTDQVALQTVLANALRHLATTFLDETTPWHRFMVRGAIAFGPVYHGVSIPEGASWTLDAHPSEKGASLLGLPMAQAYQEEGKAPPYGISIDASARAFAPPGALPFPFIWWDWFSKIEPRLDPDVMYDALAQHFEWCAAHTNMTGYDPKRIEAHRLLAAEYFGRTTNK